MAKQSITLEDLIAHLKKGGPEVEKLNSLYKEHVEKETEHQVIVENARTHQKHIYVCEDEEHAAEVAKHMHTLTKTSNPIYAGHRLTLDGPSLNEKMIDVFGAANRSVDVEDGRAYLASSTSNSNFQHWNRAKTMQKIEHEKKKDRDAIRLLKVLEKRRAARK